MSLCTWCDVSTDRGFASRQHHTGPDPSTAVQCNGTATWRRFLMLMDCVRVCVLCQRPESWVEINPLEFKYVLTVINTVYFSTWLHKHKVRLTKFWNSDRNHRPNALREMFSSLQHSLGRHSLVDLTCWISSRLTICVRDHPCFTVFRIKIEKNSCVIAKFNAILGCWRFCAN